MRLFFLVFALVALAGCGSDNGNDSAAPAGSGQLEITETEFALDPDNATVDAAGKTSIRVVNNGALTHALEVENDDLDFEEKTDPIAPGESATLTVDLQDGEYELYCPIDDHKSKGMETTLLVGSHSFGDGTDTGETDTDEDSGYGG
jgi:plastocyanin